MAPSQVQVPVVRLVRTVSACLQQVFKLEPSLIEHLYARLDEPVI